MVSVFFAAGNAGDSGAGSLTMSSSSKNVVAVGASESLALDGQTNSQNIGYGEAQGERDSGAS